MGKILVNNIYNIVDNVFNDKKNKENIIDYINKYIDNNSNVLYAESPMYRLFFSDEKDRAIIFDTCKISSKEVLDIIKKVEEIKANWKIVRDPFNILMGLIIRKASIDKDEKLLYNTLLYLTLSLYSSLHYKYFRYLPNENCMKYTVNNMNKKFLFKKYGVVIKALYHTAESSHEKYEKELIRGNDLDIKNYIMNLRTRLNNLMQKFTSEYKKNLDNKKYLNSDTDSNDEENYRETENLSLVIENLTSATMNKFNSSSLNPQFIRVSAKFSDCSPITLKNALESIKKKEDKKVIELVRNILSIYLIVGEKSYESISSKEFILYNISLYSKSNIKDKYVLRMKELLDEFLKVHCDKYSSTERSATRSAYRKALFIYFVLLIQSSKK